MNVAALIVRHLELMGVKRVYGLIGTSVLDFVDALKDSGIRYVSTRFDQAAASMAAGEGRTTGEPGVAVVHGGPGFLNALTALAVAYKDSVPLLLISGAVKRRMSGLNSWLEVPQLEIASRVAKASYRIDRQAEAARKFSEAYASASERPHGPVFVEVPEDVWRLEAGEPLPRQSGAEPPAPSQEDIEYVLRLLERSESPVILAGGGVNNESGSRLLREFAEEHGLPVCTTGNGRGAMPEDSPLCLGRVGFGGGNTAADYAVQECGALVAIGCGVSDVTTYGYNFVPKGEVVAVTLDDGAAAKPVPYSRLIRCDAASFLASLSGASRSFRASRGWLEKLEGMRRAWEASLRSAAARRYDGFVNPARFFTALDSALPRDAIVAAGQGLHVIYAHDFIRIRRHSSFLASTNLGSMGFALPAAVGAKIANSGREVLAVVGDGEFMMSVGELETIRREGAGVRVVVVNDNSYRVLLMRQKIQKMGRVHGTLHTNPDTVKLGEAFGIESSVLERDEEIEPAVSFLLSGGGPKLLELRVSREDLPPTNVEASLRF